MEGSTVPRSLSRAQADTNLSVIQGQVAYNLKISLNEKEFKGEVSICFSLSTTKDIFLCFRQKLDSFTLNEAKFEPHYDGEIITFKGAEGLNKIVCHFTCQYSQTWGDGPSKLIADGKTYVFTLNEHYGTSRFFPCFDQPSIRGKYSLELEYPEDWGMALSNGTGTVLSSQDGRKKMSFIESEPLPSYLFYLFVGNFMKYECPPNDISNVPQNYYCLPHAWTKLNQVVEVLNRITSYSLKFLQEFLSSQYPFQTYHHVFIPSGIIPCCADELPGAVIVDEYYLDRHSDSNWIDWIFILCHEMVHMWFGDLVAIEFWDITWQKETFADLLATLAMEELVRIQAEKKIDLGFSKNQLEIAVDCMKFKRRGDGWHNDHGMRICGRCRPLIKTDIKYSDEGFANYGDDIYGKSMFDAYQFLSLTPTTLRRFCSEVVKRHQWSYVNERSYLDIVKSFPEYEQSLGADKIEDCFSKYFKHLGYVEIKAEISKIEQNRVAIKFYLDPKKIDRNFILQVASRDSSGKSTNVAVTVLPESKFEIYHNPNAELFKANEKDNTIEFYGSEVVIDSLFWNSLCIKMDYNQYIESLSEATLQSHILLIINQLIMSECKISNKTLVKLCKVLINHYPHLVFFWYSKFSIYIDDRKLKCDLLEDFAESMIEKFLKDTELWQDYFNLFDDYGIDDKKTINKIMKHLIDLLKKDGNQHFDFIYVREYLYNNKDVISPDDFNQALNLVTPKNGRNYYLEVHGRYENEDPIEVIEAALEKNEVAFVKDFLCVADEIDKPQLQAAIDKLKKKGCHTILLENFLADDASDDED